MFKHTKHYDPTPTEGAGAEQVEAPAVETTPVAEAPLPEVVAEKESVPFDQLEVEWDKIIEVPAEKIDEPTAEKKEEKPAEEKSETPAAEIKVEEENDGELKLEPIAKATETEKESTWIETAKELGFEIKEDTFEAFKVANEKRLEDIRLEERNKQYELKLDEHSERSKELIKFLDKGGDVKDFLEPLKVYDEAMKLSAEELVEIDLQTKNWDPEKIKEQIEILKEEGKLEQTGYALTKQIEANKSAKENQLLAQQEQLFQEKETKRLEVVEKENNAIKDVVFKKDEYRGGKLNKEVKEAIYQKWLNGDYRKRFESDPDFVVNAILDAEFGEKQFKQLAKDKFQEGKEKIVAKLHNTKKVEKGVQRAESPGGFDAWEVALNGGAK